MNSILKKPYFPVLTGLLFAIFVGSVLRLHQLAYHPPGLYWDEASIAYNVYSLVQTGSDEFGRPWPFWFEAFGEYKLPGYIYATAISFLAFGATDFAVRLPSALAGILTIPAVFFFTKTLFHHSKERFPNPLLIATLAALFFAISPWSIQFSRAGFEANLALCFLVWGAYFALQGIGNQRWHLTISGIFFILSLVTYNSARLFIPFLLIAAAIIYRRQLSNKPKPTLKAIVVAALLFLPFLPAQLDTLGFKRAGSTSYLDNLSPAKSLEKFTDQYSDNFDSNFLFFHGDQIGRHSTRKLGMLYYFDLPLILIGLWLLYRYRSQPTWLITAWLLIAPLPSAITTPSPHALRTLNILPAWIILSALGLSFLITQLLALKPKKLVVPLGLLFILFTILYNFTLFTTEYWIRYPKDTGLDWSDGFKEAVEVVKYQGDRYDHVYLSDSVPLIYLAFYLPIPPEDFQQLGHPEPSSHPTIGHITYFSQAWKIPQVDNTVLVIAPAHQTPGPETPYQTITIQNGDAIFNIWEKHANNQSL